MKEEVFVSRERKILVTCALLLSNAMAGLDATIVNTALPAIVSDLHGIQYMGWIVAIFLLGMAVATPLWSKFGERHGNKFAYITTTTVFAVGALFQGLAPNVAWFIIARGVMGIGAGGMSTIPFIIYAQLFSNLKRRAQVIGITSASFSTASIIGPLIGGWIVDAFSWHWVFYLNLPLAALSVLIVGLFFKSNLALNRAPVDYQGAILMVLGLVAILIGIQLLGTASIWLTALFILLGLALLWRMHGVENRVKDPIVPNRLFHNSKLVIDLIIFAFLWGSFVAFNIYVPMWAQGIMGLSALIGGMTQIPGSIANFLGSELAPVTQVHLGRYQVLALGTATFLITFVGMSLVAQTASYTFLLVMGAFNGFGIGVCFTTLQVAVQSDVSTRDVPIATSFAYLVRILSQTFMSSIYGVILNQALMAGVKAHSGEITMNMLNKLSNSQTAGSLPVSLLPQMRTILFNGMHHIMIMALILVLVIVLLLGYLLLRQHRAPVVERQHQQHPA
ncbi:MFS transporter [Levilactobacillus suantsaii]|uniref:MFS transporter n=1 Tax=Levilactobacillus suantsaii TaxID=2292255 RepID=A0A4Q0VIC3_9LACO|nr:MFS transporter [Levilactobacillus suantsaii]QMU08838.1 MFS transporter [Levilactobacillus suantsaii]RXI76134.1 MFS transporter [Levilactobacillus suantsaii]